MKLLTLVLSAFVLQLSRMSLSASSKVAHHRLTDTDTPDDDDWWESAVFYQLLPRSFRDSDGDGDGDLRGLLERFDHLIELGVTGICLGSVFRSPMRDGGRDVSDFRTVEPAYGSMEDFVELLQRARYAGIRVVLDVVPNHTSEQHEWFQKAVRKNEDYRGYYIQRVGSDAEDGDDAVPNNWMSTYHTSAWTKHARGSEYYLHQFDASEPELNYRNARVKQEMEDIVRFWLDQGVDGLRFERVNHLFEDVQFRDEPALDPNGPVNSYDDLDHVYTRDLLENYALAFDWRELFDEYITDNTTGKRLMITSAYGSDLTNTLRWFGIANRNGAHIAQNFGLLEVLSNASRAEDYQQAIDGWLNAMPPANGVANWVLGSQDQRRVASRFGRERAAGLAMLCFTLPGTVFMYYGDEIGMKDNDEITWQQTQDPAGCNTNGSVFHQYSRDPSRTPFQWDDTDKWAGFSPPTNPRKDPWLPINTNYRVVNLAHEKSSNRSVYHLYRDLIHLRRQSGTLRHGTYQSFVLPNNVFAVLRSRINDRAYATVLNVNSNPVTVDLSRVHRFATHASVAFASPEGSHSAEELIQAITDVQLEPYETIIFELKSAARVLKAASYELFIVFGFLAMAVGKRTYL